MRIFEERKHEFDKAVERSISYGLINAAPDICAEPRLKSESLRSEIAAICLSVGPGRSTGLCQVIVMSCIEQIKERLVCDAWVVFGWLSDIAKPGSYFWKMDPSILCDGLSKGCLGVAEFHAWVMLDSGEIVDPVVYPALAENFKQFARGAGRCNILHPHGRAYKAIAGLPLLQYHPMAVMP